MVQFLVGDIFTGVGVKFPGYFIWDTSLDLKLAWRRSLKRRSLEGMAQEFNPAIFQAALLEVAEATKIATAAVQAMQSAQQSSSPQVTT